MRVLKNLKVMKDAMATGMRGAGLTDETLATMSPEQRADYEARMDQAAEASAGADAEVPASGAAVRPMTPPWSMTAPGQQQGAFAGRDEQARHEFDARQATRAPYLAAVRFPVHFTRISTRGKDEIHDVAAHLAVSGLTARADLVFGVYRVPDHFAHVLNTQRRRYIEWDIVHAASAPLKPAPSPHSVHFRSIDTWVSRSAGQPSVLDEDLSVGFLLTAGVGAHHCLGVARSLRTADRGGSEGGAGATMVDVTGVQAFTSVPLDEAFHRLTSMRPIALEVGPPPGVHIELLDWGTIAEVVHPRSGKPFIVPSPVPFLPSTAQELLRAYLDIVGVNPCDSYSAQVTEQHARDISDVRAVGRTGTVTGAGATRRCADGESRRCLTGGNRVVIAYVDRPEYADGRRRWAAYERDVLQVTLATDSRDRRPVDEVEYANLPRGLRKLIGMSEAVADIIDIGDSRTEWDRLAPHRYCWPPTDTR